MHSRIFQISTMQIEKDNYLNEDTLSQEYLTTFDYCSDIDDDIRMADIANLVNNVLPKGMFELISDDTMRYNGGIEQWKEEYVANIRKNAEAITVDNMLTHRGTHNLRKAIDNPLNVRYLFYLDGNGCQSFAEQSIAFMDFVCGLTPGAILYIGGVIDYHI